MIGSLLKGLIIGAVGATALIAIVYGLAWYAFVYPG